VRVDGDLTVTGAKGAVVPHPDGSQRLLCAIESPESWFEDFAEATLDGGRAEIELDPDFAQLTRTDRYHVFLTAYGPSNGLYVEARSARSFVVREQQNGKSNLAFSYRVVAKRRDIDVPRFKRMPAPPDVAANGLSPSESEEPGAAGERQPQLERAISPSQTREPITRARPRGNEDARRVRMSLTKPNIEERSKDK
jgi:hypothetical protein